MYHNSGLEALKGCGGRVLQASNGKLTVHVAILGRCRIILREPELIVYILTTHIDYAANNCPVEQATVVIWHGLSPTVS